MQPTLKIIRFCNFSSEIMSTWFRKIIIEACNENLVDKSLITKVFKKNNSTYDLRNRLDLKTSWSNKLL